MDEEPRYVNPYTGLKRARANRIPTASNKKSSAITVADAHREDS